VQSHRTDKFIKAFDNLPEPIKRKAREVYNVWKINPSHPSHSFKQIGGIKNVYSSRIGLNYRALGVKDDDKIIWFWIGSHEDYNNMINQL
jgi:hypothetical protein